VRLCACMRVLLARSCVQISLLVCKRGDVWSNALRWNLSRVRTTMVTVQHELNDHFGVPVLIEYEAGAGALAPLRSQVCARAANEFKLFFHIEITIAC
jgi:hypothetical protein